MNISKNIKKIRRFKKLSQQSFGESFGLTRASVSAYEDGRAKPKMETLLNIANFFNIPLEIFINEELTINQLSHFEEHIPSQNKHTESSFQFNVRFLSQKSVIDFLENKNNNWINDQPVISFPFPVRASEIAFSVHPDVFNISIPNVNEGDILFCQKVKDFSNFETQNYLLMLDNRYLVSEFSYDQLKNCLVNSRNSLEKIFKDEISGIFKIIAMLSNSISTTDLEQIKEVRQNQKKLDKYLKL